MTIRKLIFVIIVLLIAPAAARTASLDVRDLERGGFADILRNHVGRPIIVHFWGMTCGPCLVELPEWGRLLRERPGLDLVTIHAERAPHPRVLSETLAEAGLTNAENWAFGETSPERLRFEIDPSWHGELPMTLLIGADGSPQRIIGSADFASIRHWLDTRKSSRLQQGSGRQLQVSGSQNSDHGASPHVF